MGFDAQSRPRTCIVLLPHRSTRFTPSVSWVEHPKVTFFSDRSSLRTTTTHTDPPRLPRTDRHFRLRPPAPTLPDSPARVAVSRRTERSKAVRGQVLTRPLHSEGDAATVDVPGFTRPPVVQVPSPGGGDTETESTGASGGGTQAESRPDTGNRTNGRGDGC